MTRRSSPKKKLYNPPPRNPLNFLPPQTRTLYELESFEYPNRSHIFQITPGNSSTSRSRPTSKAKRIHLIRILLFYFLKKKMKSVATAQSDERTQSEGCGQIFLPLSSPFHELPVQADRKARAIKVSCIYHDLTLISKRNNYFYNNAKRILYRGVRRGQSHSSSVAGRLKGISPSSYNNTTKDHSLFSPMDLRGGRSRSLETVDGTFLALSSVNSVGKKN